MPEQYQVAGSSSREIAASVERAVRAGALAPGEALPSVRALAARLEVSPTTVAGAFAQLRRRGVVVSRARSGTRVADRPPLRPARGLAALPAGVRDLASGSPDIALLPPLAAFSPAHRLYGDDVVLGDLAAVAGAAFAADGLPAAGVAVVSGALDGIERVLQAHLAPGDAVAVEDPGWPGVLDLGRALGLALRGVRVDERGMRPEGLAAALRSGARAVVVTPRGHNPQGAAHDAERAAELRAVLAGAADVLVVEDDHLGPVAGTPWHTLVTGRERWAAVRSVSKWLGPDLRVAVLAGDELTLSRVEGRQALGPGWVSGINQALAATLWRAPATTAVVARAARAYAERRAGLAGALEARGVPAAPARGGINLWIPVPDEDAAARGMLAAGYAIAPGSAYRLGAGPAVRITTAALPEDEASAVAAALAVAVRPPRRTRAA